MMKKLFNLFLGFCALAAVSFIVFIGIHCSFMFFLFSTISCQGKILNVLPDTKFLNDDSQILFFKDHKSLYSIKLNGEQESKIHANTLDYRWSPNGKSVVLRTKEKKDDVMIVDLKTNKKEIIEYEKDCSLPEWSPDSSKLVYLVEKEEGYKHDIFIFDINTKVKTKIERPAEYVTGVKWIIDGKSIIYDAFFTKEYYKYDLNTKKQIRLSPVYSSKLISWHNFVDVKTVHFNQFASSVSSYVNGDSPNEKYRVYNEEGSLYLEKHGQAELLVEFKGIYNEHLGQPGIDDMEWLPNNRIVVFNFKHKIYSIDIQTKKAGYLTKGSNPLAHIPNYRPATADSGKLAIMYY